MASKISEKLIKPPSPTAPTKRCHKLSLTDQAFSNYYIPFALFYTKQQLDTISKNPTQLSQLLEESLSRILSVYYPYAGRLNDNATIDCNNEGAEFFQVQIDCPIVESFKDGLIVEDTVFPKGLPWSNSTDRALLAAQVTYFNCGGIAISMCVSHKIGDGGSAYNIFHDWAEITRDPNWPKPTRHYAEQSIFPPPSSGPLISPVITSNKVDCVQRKFTFTNQKLSHLKDLVVAESQVKNPSRTEVVFALLFKCATAAANINSSSNFLASTMHLPIDLRAKVGLPENAIGNLLDISSISIVNEDDLNMPKLVRELRKSIEHAYKRDNVNDNLFVPLLLELAKLKRDYYGPNTYQFTSLVKFPLHEIDFGWGKPTKVSIANGLNYNWALLLSNQNGGLDAYLSLSRLDMSVLERDPELLEFASLDG